MSLSPAQFVNELRERVLSHKAVRHPFLQKLSTGDFKKIDDVIRDYSHQYSFYSQWFPEYVQSVIDTTDDPLIIHPLAENLAEELGTDDADENNVPHTELYKMFKKDIGIDAEFENQNPMCLTVSLWRELFLQKCKSKSTAVGVSAVGLATEFIVPHFYPYIIDALEKHSSFPNKCSFFFRLHVECDEGHAEEAIEVATYLAEDNINREAMTFGAISALNLRNAFLDNQLNRAREIEGR